MKLTAIGGLICLMLVLAAPGSGRAAELSGDYVGVGEAEGAEIRIAPDAEGFEGVFFDPSGASQRFQADRDGAAAEAVLDMDNRAVLIRITPLPYGAEVALIPFAADGLLDIQAGRVLNFVRSDLELPRPPEEFRPAPVDTSGAVTANGFLASYAFWPPSGVRNGYLALPSRFQTLLRLVPTVQLDVIWKLCLAPDPDRALSIALSGQGVGCDEVLTQFAEMQASGRFNRFKQDVAADREVLRDSVRCADGYRVAQDVCDAAARRISDHAAALETAATVLARYR